MTTSFDAGRVPEFDVHDRCRKARESAGMNQSEFAELTGISKRSISGYESGARAPRRPQLIVWAMSTGVPLQWLETGNAPSPGGDGAGGVRPEGFEPPTFCYGHSGRVSRIGARRRRGAVSSGRAA